MSVEENKETKYGKHIITEMKQNIAEASWTMPVSVAGKGEPGRVLWLDSEVFPGAFYIETVWQYPPTNGEEPRVTTEQHTHDFDEAICFFGTNPEDPYDLCGEIELWLEDEKHTINRSCIIYVPAGMKHCPLVINRVDRPIFEFTVGPGTMYG